MSKRNKTSPAHPLMYIIAFLCDRQASLVFDMPLNTVMACANDTAEAFDLVTKCGQRMQDEFTQRARRAGVPEPELRPASASCHHICGALSSTGPSQVLGTVQSIVCAPEHLHPQSWRMQILPPLTPAVATSTLRPPQGPPLGYVNELQQTIAYRRGLS